jgi:hypothetical protein
MTAVFRLCRIGRDEDQAGGPTGQRADESDSLAAPTGWAILIALLLLLGTLDKTKKTKNRESPIYTFVRFCLHWEQP